MGSPSKRARSRSLKKLSKYSGKFDQDELHP